MDHDVIDRATVTATLMSSSSPSMRKRDRSVLDITLEGEDDNTDEPIIIDCDDDVDDTQQLLKFKNGNNNSGIENMSDG